VFNQSLLVLTSVPQGSVLGPLEFISYTEDVVVVFTRNLVNHCLFADDKQLSEIDSIRHQLCFSNKFPYSSAFLCALKRRADSKALTTPCSNWLSTFASWCGAWGRQCVWTCNTWYQLATYTLSPVVMLFQCRLLMGCTKHALYIHTRTDGTMNPLHYAGTHVAMNKHYMHTHTAMHSCTHTTCTWTHCNAFNNRHT